MIPNTNFEIGSQRMYLNTIALSANHNKIQQFHVEFSFLFNFLKTLWITIERGWQNGKKTKKRVGLDMTFKDNFNAYRFCELFGFFTQIFKN